MTTEIEMYMATSLALAEPLKKIMSEKQSNIHNVVKNVLHTHAQPQQMPMYSSVTAIKNQIDRYNKILSIIY